MSQTLRIGILGASKIAPISILKPARERSDIEVTCLASRQRARAEAMAAEYGIASVASSYSELLSRDDVDLVHVSLPPSAHAEWSIRALEAGKAVLCEKPFALNGTEAQEMVDASERAGQPLIEAFHYRHHAVMRRLMDIVERQELGQLLRIQANFDVPIPFSENEFRWTRELGGGALMDLGCYAVHAARTVAKTACVVESSSAYMVHGVDARTDALLLFDGGLSAHVGASMVAERFKANLTVEGENGTVEIRNFVAPHLGCTFRTVIGGFQHEEPTETFSTFAAQLQHLSNVMLHGAMPLTGGEDAIANMQALDAIRAAAGYSDLQTGG